MKLLHNERSEGATDKLYLLSLGPDKRVNTYSGCMVNGVRFLTKDRGERRVTQNSGVCVDGVHKGKELEFYGVLDEVIELTYVKDCRVVLFKCEWYDLERNKPIQIDDDFVSINIGKKWYTNDPYILATQANNVFYVQDTKLKQDWRVVQKAHHRHLYDEALLKSLHGDEEKQLNDDPYQEEVCGNVRIEEDNVEIGPLIRQDIDPEIINITNDAQLRVVDDFICHSEHSETSSNHEDESESSDSESSGSENEI